MDSSDLDVRMGLFKEGQITWPTLGHRNTCDMCRHYGKATGPGNKGLGRCTLIRKHYRKPGKAFDGKAATACSMFEAKE